MSGPVLGPAGYSVPPSTQAPPGIPPDVFANQSLLTKTGVAPGVVRDW